LYKVVVIKAGGSQSGGVSGGG